MRQFMALVSIPLLTLSGCHKHVEPRMSSVAEEVLPGGVLRLGMIVSNHDFPLEQLVEIRAALAPHLVESEEIWEIRRVASDLGTEMYVEVRTCLSCGPRETSEVGGGMIYVVQRSPGQSWVVQYSYGWIATWEARLCPDGVCWEKGP